jgi:uncharacterized protein
MTAKKNQPKKNLLMQITVVIVLLALVAYFIVSSIPVKNETKNEETDKALDNKTVYSFVKQGDLSFTDAKDNFKTKINIEIADNDDKRTTGLMFRDKMDENQGMLFIFDSESPQAFWMKNTILPLDIIFVNSKMQIVKIQKNAEPYSEKSLPSEKPAQYVVEVNAGYCDKLGVKEGDKITWRRD